MVLVNIGELLSASIDLAERAGEIIRGVQKSGDLQVKIKGYSESGVEDPLTQADVKAQALIINGLLSRWPCLSILAEEDRPNPLKDLNPPRLDRFDISLVPFQLRSVLLSDVAVIIDPVDATREFTKGHVECVTTLIGITVKGVPKAGVIYQPFVGDGVSVYGIVGVGVFGVEHSGPHAGLVVATTASHGAVQVEHAIECIKPDHVMRVGGAGYKALLLLGGQADVYVFPIEGCKLWDTCAPEALIVAAGGKLTDSTGAMIAYRTGVDVHVRKGVLATLKDHSRFVALIN